MSTLESRYFSSLPKPRREPWPVLFNGAPQAGAIVIAIASSLLLALVLS